MHDIKKKLNTFVVSGCSRLSREATGYIMEQFTIMEMLLAIEIEKRAEAEGILKGWKIATAARDKQQEKTPTTYRDVVKAPKVGEKPVENQRRLF